MQIIQGLQGILIWFYCSAFFSHVTGIGGFGSFAFGFFGVCAIYGLAFTFLPRITIWAGGLFWGVMGYQLGLYVFGDMSSGVAGALILGVVGLVANFQIMRDVVDPDAAAVGEYIAGGSPDAQRVVLKADEIDNIERHWEALYVLRGIRAVSLSTFQRLDKSFSETLGVQGSQAIGSANNENPTTDKITSAAIILPESGLLSQAEIDEMHDRLTPWLGLAV
ncbi:hypothetical protein [uncultured Sulfitobacter sp.]|uniref:hypothetical protein n=1 Tax=uncultured Sulfitobacter sp. TaxID=191468 RepID=UPI00260708A3|nr:hypothetical protein [uncultured Sulfitobacter sp.]